MTQYEFSFFFFFFFFFLYTIIVLVNVQPMNIGVFFFHTRLTISNGFDPPAHCVAFDKKKPVAPEPTNSY